MQTRKILGTYTVSVIIPVYNTKELVIKNLPYVIKASKDKSNRIKEIIVVDDASTDDSAQAIKKSFPEVRIIKHTKNRGFAASVNTGARSSFGKLIVLLNSDVIPEKDFLVHVLDNFDDPRVFGISFNEKGYSWTTGYFEDGFIVYKESSVKNKIAETFWLSGGSSIYRRDYWMKLGGMDEKLLSPYYWEDIDLSYRAAKRGLLNLWDPRGKVSHEHESTMKKLNQVKVMRIRERNHLLIHWKNLTSKTLFRKHIAGLFKRLLRHPGYSRILFMALFRLRTALRARKKELAESKISDEALLSKFRNA